MLPKEPLTRRITLRLSDSEDDKLNEDAHLAHLTKSELIRRRYFGRPIMAATDANTIRELRRIGGLLKHIYGQTGSTYSSETAAALNAVKDYIETLAHDHQKS
jgi:Ribbon-helix-helix protein, copG family